VSEETELQLAKRGSDNAPVFADARVRLVSRGRMDAALFFLEPPDPFLKIRQLAETGDAKAQIEVGDTYYYGFHHSKEGD
jgi:hypothetical protein